MFGTDTPDGLFFIDAGSMEKAMAKALADHKLDPLRAIGEWSPEGGDASAKLALDILLEQIAANGVAKRYRDGSMTGDVKACRLLADELFNTLQGHDDIDHLPSGAAVVRYALEGLGLQRVLLAKICNVSASKVTRWLSGESDLSYVEFQKIRSFAITIGRALDDERLLGKTSTVGKVKRHGKTKL